MILLLRCARAGAAVPSRPSGGRRRPAARGLRGGAAAEQPPHPPLSPPPSRKREMRSSPGVAGPLRLLSTCARGCPGAPRPGARSVRCPSEPLRPSLVQRQVRATDAWKLEREGVAGLRGPRCAASWHRAEGACCLMPSSPGGRRPCRIERRGHAPGIPASARLSSHVRRSPRRWRRCWTQLAMRKPPSRRSRSCLLRKFIAPGPPP